MTSEAAPQNTIPGRIDQIMQQVKQENLPITRGDLLDALEAEFGADRPTRAAIEFHVRELTSPAASLESLKEHFGEK